MKYHREPLLEGHQILFKTFKRACLEDPNPVVKSSIRAVAAETAAQNADKEVLSETPAVMKIC